MPSRTHIFRVRLWPNVSRDIEIESSKSLYDLAAAIVQAFDFDLDHAFGFYSKLDDYVFDSPVRYELFADLDGGREAQRGKPPPILRLCLSRAARCSSCLTTAMTGGSGLM